jgi:hypothetical protein
VSWTLSIIPKLDPRRRTLHDWAEPRRPIPSFRVERHLKRERTILINDMLSEPLNDACQTRCRTCGATVWQYPTAKDGPILLDNATGRWVIREGKALRATQGAGYRGHHHDSFSTIAPPRVAAVDDAEFLWL